MQKLKAHLTNLLLLSKPNDDKTLYLYIVVSEFMISIALIQEDEGKQYLVYYTIKALLDVETRYNQLKKLTLALVKTAR